MRRAFAAVPLLLVAACQSTSVSSDDSGNVAVVVKNYGDCLAAIGAKQSDLYGDVNRDGHDGGGSGGGSRCRCRLGRGGGGLPDGRGSQPHSKPRISDYPSR